MSENQAVSDADLVATTSVVVAADPATAFRVFTEQIGTWWRRGTHYWNDSKRGLRLEFEPGVGGRLLEVYDESGTDVFEIGRIVDWVPAHHLRYTWREAGWAVDTATDVDITFEAADGGTRVTVVHSGWERVGHGDDGYHRGYASGWVELLGWYGETARGESLSEPS